MNQPSKGVPTLTEVVTVAEGDATEPMQLYPAEPALPNEDDLVERVLADVSRQVELMLEYRLRETLTPVLARATDALVREARNELAQTLRDVIARAVAQELARHRGRDEGR
jgi:plasmid replication initiation protein